MFDWKAERASAERRVADLEERIALLRDQLGRDEQPTHAIERNRQLLSIQLASLERAKSHVHFLEHKLELGTRPVKAFPYLELAVVCFKAAMWMCKGAAADEVRKNAATFYTKAMALNQTSPSDATARAIFDSVSRAWDGAAGQEHILPDHPEVHAPGGGMPDEVGRSVHSRRTTPGVPPPRALGTEMRVMA
jgi:hypothetical protein